MKTITYTNNQGLELKINKFASGAFSLTFNNGARVFCVPQAGDIGPRGRDQQ
jgi:hypothetical protein